MATELLNNISSDEIQRAHFRSRRLYERDRESERTVIRDEGISKGIAIGKAEERAESMRNFALKLLKRNRPIEEIIEDTGLPRTEIERLSRQ